MMDTLILFTIIISCFVLIGGIFALPLRLAVLRNQSKPFRWRLALFLSLAAYVFTFALIAHQKVLITMAAGCSSGFPLTCGGSNPEQHDMLIQELWLRNMLPLDNCFTGNEEVCEVAAEYGRDYSFQLVAALPSVATCLFWAWRFTREKPKSKRGDENTP
jgi:hypothetical protein